MTHHTRLRHRPLMGTLALCAALSAGNALAGDAPETAFPPQPITAAAAGRYAVYAMLSSNAYHKPDRVRFAVEKLGWVRVDLEGKPTDKPTRKHPISGLAYDIYEKTGTSEVVFAFRGTDSKHDYLWSNLSVPPLARQYTQAREAFREYRERNPDRKITLTGHSLGGGLALTVSVHYGIDAIVFDSTPRIFDGLGDRHEPATRVLVFEAGEILAKVRKHWDKIYEAVPPANIYRCEFDFKTYGDGSKHRSDYLARGLLELGARANPALVPVRDALDRK